ncbi:MAG: HD domain-containing protein [Bythopirellula sp.]
MNPVVDEVLQVFRERGDQSYGTEAVTQLEHALQTAALAIEHDAQASLVAAALLHDIGHIRESNQDQQGESSLDDKHEDTPYRWLLQHFGKAVADPVRLHVVAKRYLCTKQADYERTLSPTSHESYLQQGGRMDDAELAAFEAEEFWREALRLRVWDDTAKDPTKATPPIEEFITYVERALLAT